MQKNAGIQNPELDEQVQDKIKKYKKVLNESSD